jgi:hypothetical protein
MSQLFGVYWHPDTEVYGLAFPQPPHQPKSIKTKTKSKDETSGDSKSDTATSDESESELESGPFAYTGASTHPLWDYELFLTENEKKSAGASASPVPSLQRLLESARWKVTRNDIRIVLSDNDQTKTSLFAASRSRSLSM